MWASLCITRLFSWPGRAEALPQPSLCGRRGAGWGLTPLVQKNAPLPADRTEGAGAEHHVWFSPASVSTDEPTRSDQTHNPSQRLEAARGAPGETGGRRAVGFICSTWGCFQRNRWTASVEFAPHRHQPEHRSGASPDAPDHPKVIVGLGIFWY